MSTTEVIRERTANSHALNEDFIRIDRPISTDTLEKIVQDIKSAEVDYSRVAFENFHFVVIPEGHTLRINPRDYGQIVVDMDETLIRDSGPNIHDGPQARFALASRVALSNRGLIFSDQDWPKAWEEIFKFGGGSEANVLSSLAARLNELVLDPKSIDTVGTFDENKKFIRLHPTSLTRINHHAINKLQNEQFPGVEPVAGGEKFLDQANFFEMPTHLRTASGGEILAALKTVPRMEVLKKFTTTECGVAKMNFSSREDTFIGKISAATGTPPEKMLMIGDSPVDGVPHFVAGGTDFILIFDGSPADCFRQMAKIYTAYKDHKVQSSDQMQGQPITVSHDVFIYVIKDFNQVEISEEQGRLSIVAKATGAVAVRPD